MALVKGKVSRKEMKKIEQEEDKDDAAAAAE